MKPPEFFWFVVYFFYISRRSAADSGKYRTAKHPYFQSKNARFPPSSAKQADFPHFRAETQLHLHICCIQGIIACAGTLCQAIFTPDFRPRRAFFQPCLCLWLLFLEQMTITLPFLLMTLHLSHMGFTEGLTFITNSSSSPKSVRGVIFSLLGQDLLRQVIRPLVRS